MIKFGVAGNSKSFYDEGYTQTIEAGLWCKNRGIDAFEYSFGRGITLNEKTAKEIGNAFRDAGVEMSAHAPYFINLANPDPEMIKKSYAHITNSLKKVKDFGGSRVVVHPATQGKMQREDAINLMVENAKGLIDVLDELGYGDGYKICFETMGKLAQLGTVDEIIKVCSLDERFYPCIDFGHINAREQGILKSALNYNTIVQKMSDFLPKHKVLNMHVHFSKIEYGAKGEIRHLTFEDQKYGPDYEPLMEVFHQNGLEPYVICESDGTQAEDTVQMKKYFFSL
ncbi:MAG: TIM barrel protein [Clostridia bacterium]|nr:TIM barrel protein [Clostridia bacterium]